MKKLFGLVAAGAATFTLASCGVDYDLYIYNSKGENADAFTAMAKTYEEETGVKLKTFSIGSGQDHMETLRAEMNSKNAPGIYSIQGSKELLEWEEGGFALDLNSVDDHAEFEALVDQIGNSQQLTTEGTKQYGIPYNVEGYGFIVNTEYLKSLFNNPADTLVEDLKLSTYAEFEAFVRQVQTFAGGIGATTTGGGDTVTLNGNAYTLAQTAPSQLVGAFSVMGAEKWTYGDHSINVALATKFKTPADVLAADDINDLQGALEAYAKMLDLKTSNLGMVAGTTGSQTALTRGSAFITGAEGGYDPAVLDFVNGSALFIKQGNWAYSNIKDVDAEYADDLEFIPVKLDVTDSIVVRDDMNATEFNQTIPVFVGNYYAINSKSSSETQKLAMDFLVWLNTSEEGMRIVTEDFNFIPFNADPAEVVLPNSLGNSILSYMQSDIPTLGAPYHGAPAVWSGDTVGKYLLENYMNQVDSWTTADYTKIADNAQSSFIETKNA